VGSASVSVPRPSPGAGVVVGAGAGSHVVGSAGQLLRNSLAGCAEASGSKAVPSFPGRQQDEPFKLVQLKLGGDILL